MTPDNGFPDLLREAMAGFSRRRILVVGDAILDEYVYGDCGRISPEAPVPVVRVTRSRNVLGGAANTAANVVSLGGQATLIALVSNDESGGALRTLAQSAGIDLRAIDHRLPTLRKTRVVSQQQQMLRLDREPDALPHQVDQAILDCVDQCMASCDLVVISDYAKGLLSIPLAQAILQRAHAAGRLVVVDPRPQNRACYVGCDYMTPNWREARALLGLQEAEATPAATLETARALAAALDTNILLTLGAQGIMFYGRAGSEHFLQPTLAREVFDVSGAGDTVVAAFALARAANVSHQAAVALANQAASVVVGKFGTATVTAEEILQNGGSLRLVGRSELAALADDLRAKGRRIVTINGSFDLLHSGHLHVLDEAHRCGDVLIVGLNSDASVRSYKGPARPIVPQLQRAQMLLALRVVDYVHIFDEENPIAFINEVRPDVHANGAEYGEHCVERDAVINGGGRLHLVARLPGLSTSEILDACRRAYEEAPSSR